MPAGTATQSDSYWLSQSPVFQHRVSSALVTYCETVVNEVPTGVTGSMPNTVHQARAQFVKTILNPVSWASWLTQFVTAAAADGNVIAAATNAASNYTPITSAALGDTAAAEGGAVTATLTSNAVAAAFNPFVPGI